MKKDGRVYLRISAALKKRVQEYAKRHHTDVSTIVVRFLVQLVEDDEKRINPEDADQV